MNILHISDLHFGPRHWDGNNELLLEKLNRYNADLIFNTGDSTANSLEKEFRDAGNFLNHLKCENIISVIGNHDKRNVRSHQLFRRYIYDAEVIYPLNPETCSKDQLYIERADSKTIGDLTDINFIRTVSINGRKNLIICIDPCQLFNDYGYVEESILDSISFKISQIPHDECLLLSHFSCLASDELPLTNSLRLIDFINKHKIEHVFCGHTHELEMRLTTDLYSGHKFTQYMCGSTTASNHAKDDNMFLFYENLGSISAKIHIVRVFPEGNSLRFEEELIQSSGYDLPFKKISKSTIPAIKIGIAS